MIQSAGVLLYRKRAEIEVFLIHMGGPIWINRDTAAWSIPKGTIGAQEDPLAAAKREFAEETGFALTGKLWKLGQFRQNSQKNLAVWATEGDGDPSKLVSNTFSMAWPPKFGILQQFPEADRGAWLVPADALVKIVKGQRAVLEAFYDSSVLRSR